MSENVDILICGGDVVEDNLVGDEYDDFIEWFASQPCKWKIFVPCNHELSFEMGRADGIAQIMTNRGKQPLTGGGNPIREHSTLVKP